jgi:hypothetical protein
MVGKPQTANARRTRSISPAAMQLQAHDSTTTFVCCVAVVLAGTTNVLQALYITSAVGGLGPLQMNTASLNFSCEFAAIDLNLASVAAYVCHTGPAAAGAAAADD